jgi:crossover junction endodeoxyribonuclease RuvC
LVRIHQGLTDLVEKHRPQAGSVESLVFHKDPQAAAKLGHARGAVLVALASGGVELFEYAPARVKRTLTGRGQADKRQVAEMVRAVLGLGAAPSSDAADALALAITHHRVGPMNEALQQLAVNRPAHAALVAGRRGRRRPASRTV